MDCKQVYDAELGEKYLNRQLDEVLETEFELHLLECQACQQRLDLLQNLRNELAEHAHEIRAHRAPSHIFGRWLWVPIAAGLALVCGLGVWQLRQHPTLGPSMAEKEPAPRNGVESPPSNNTTEGSSGSASNPLVSSEELSQSRSSKINVRPQKNSPPSKPVVAKASENPNPVPTRVTPEKTSSQTPAPTEIAAVPQRSEQPKTGEPALMSDEGERELFRLSAVRPAPYNFSGVASRRGFDTGASSAAPRGVESATEQRALFADAMRAYVDRNYDEASDLLHRVLQADPEASDANFYLGVILLLKGRPDQAVEPLRFAATNGRDRWSQPAHFYLAKTYLQTRDLASAESELKAAADIAGPWTGTAKADLATLQALRSREGR